MSLIDDITNKFNSATNNAMKKANEIIDVNKFKKNIKDEEIQIDNLYRQIGKIIYAKFESNISIDSNLKEICEQILNHENRIEEYKEKISVVKNIKICTNCKKEIDKSVTFCPVCGTKQEEIVNDEESSIICMQCGTKNSRLDKICKSCGGDL